MDTQELIEILGRGEDSRHQFKADITNADSLASEIVAMSNGKGGRILIGVNDDGSVRGLTGDDVRRLNQLASNASSNGVRPAVNTESECVDHPSGTVMVVSVPEGPLKPYMDRLGAIWVKSASDKRRATSRDVLQRIFQEAGLLHADAMPVSALGVGDVDLPYFESFLREHHPHWLAAQEIPLPQLLSNMRVMAEGRLSVAGALCFAKAPQYALPDFIVKAVAFPGTAITDDRYLDSRDIAGKLIDVFHQTLGFLTTNTRAVQGEQGFNSVGISEIPVTVWEELVTNALVHRDYFVRSTIRVLVFADRIEIISPGHLPNTMSIENVTHGVTCTRNSLVVTFASKLLPYHGLGSGVMRAIAAYPHISFVDDRDGNLFKCVVARPGAAHT